ncbi:MAG: hypothetical protein M0R50_08745 [Candidatus Cloacimonetes bacterium]|jgi:hypothetical protein|nr:hypothetical protein [Candidatus Cloacimonadota bacterium]
MAYINYKPRGSEIMPWDAERYLPSEELIAKQKDEIKKQRLLKLQKNKSKPGKKYLRGIINVPSDYRPVIGTNYQ